MSTDHVYADRWADPRVIFDGLSQNYDLYRPRYAPQSLENLLARTGPVRRVLDLACGTGILTRQLKPLVGDALLIGADPGRDMLVQAAASEGGAGIPWLACRAEALPFADNSLDLMTVGQAAHWFDRPAFYDACRRTLRFGGTLAILYNNRLRGEPVAEAHEHLLEKLAPGYSREYRDYDVEGELARHAAAHDVHSDRLVWNWERSFEQFMGYVRSTSHYKVACQHRPESEVTGLFAATLGRLMSIRGTLVVPYETVVTTARFG